MTAQPLTIQESAMYPLVAPSRLTADNRLEFRKVALQAVAQAAQRGATAVELDLGTTVEVDASGLGVLILVQKRARESGMTTRLLNVPGIVEKLLDDTRLEPLFEVVRAD